MSKPLPILVDQKRQNALDKHGYLLIDFLGEKEVAQLNELFHSLNDSRTDIPYDRLYTCLHNPDAAYRKQMNDRIAEICKPFFEQHFSHSKNTSFTFQIKGIGPDSELHPHQDWSFTEESLGFYTYTFWLPLVDSHSQNGTLSVLPDSHHYLRDKRGAGIEPVFSNFRNYLKKYTKTIHIKPGQLLLFDSALIHYSSANLSNQIRVSVMTNIVREEAEMYLYFRNNENMDMVDEYIVQSDFFMHYENFKEEYFSPPPFAKFNKTFLAKEVYYEEEEVLKMVKKIKNHDGILGRLKSMFHEAV